LAEKSSELSIFDSNAFKLNAGDSGQNLTITKEGIFIKQADGPNGIKIYY